MAEQLNLLILNASRAERRVIKDTLKKLNVFSFIEANDSQEALKTLKQQNRRLAFFSYDSLRAIENP